jgi:prepilin-type processing-associated H-X9-DG protein
LFPGTSEYLLAVGDPTYGPSQQTGSWAYSLLPFLDGDDVYRQRAWDKGYKLYICPARRGYASQLPVNDEYGQYFGGGWKWAKTDYAVVYGPATGGRGRPKPVEIYTDGTSQTVLVGEKAMSPQLYTTGTWYWDEPYFFGNAPGNRRGGTRVIKDAPGVLFVDSWGSAHLSGVQFLYADGSVRLMKFNTSLETVQALITPNSGDLPLNND